jgi:deoxycytidine triphosphate deaminase
MILAKSELRKAIASGELKFLDDDGRTLPEWFQLTSGLMGIGEAVDPVALQPASVDLTLGSHWLWPKPNVREEIWLHRDRINVMRDTTVAVPPGHHGFHARHTDTALPMEYEAFDAPAFWLPAHGFVLARTRETIALSNDLFAMVEGRSSVGRLGITAQNAGVVDPGFRGTITLELSNELPYPILVRSGFRCCQLVVSRMAGDTEGGYKSNKYQNQVQATGSLLHKDFER